MFSETIEQAMRLFNESQATIQTIVSTQNELPLENIPLQELSQLLKHTLQYRLDTQDALLCLLRVHHNVLSILGIGREYSADINLERMEFAIGQDDLIQLMHALSHLLGLLLQAASRSQNRSKLARKKQASNATATIINQFKKATSLQQSCIKTLHQLSHDLKQLNKRAAIGPVLDHVAALRGPISQFFQAIQHGITLTQTFYQSLNLEKTISATTLTHHQPQLFHPVSQVTDSKPSLEQQAAAKRLGKFFR